MPEPIQAGLWGAIAGSALVLGAIAAITIRIPRRIVALIMAFGAGALVSSLAFDLAEEAFRAGGTLVFAIGLAAGSLVYFGGDRMIDRLSKWALRTGGRRLDPPSSSVRSSMVSRNRSCSARRSSATASTHRSSPRS